MAKERFPEAEMMEGEPEEYRIVLRRGAAHAEVTPEDLDDFLRTEPDEPEPEDIMWEGSVSDLKSADLWEEAGLVPTTEDDLYELQLKVGENDYQFVAAFGTEEDYEEAVRDVTSPHPDLVG